MEEDIKKIELFIKRNRIMFEDWGDMEANEYDLRAIEKLIKGYRELEKKIEKQELSFVKGYTEGSYNQLNVMTSKIKEKIEEYKKLIKEVQDNEEHYNEIPLYEHDIEVLQELMEEK